jgi:Na+/melibiose symporter-like transporter
MFDFSVFRVRPFSGAIFGAMGMNFSYWPFMVYLPIYFQAALGYSSVNAGLSLLAYTLPTLVVPPFAERLVLRFGARRVIPLGLLTIGIGFVLMRFGVALQHANWLTMLPGCVLCGAGLGLTNTPVTNVATGSVSASRAGMASGIDMSARLISLAINIALMGLVLLEGVHAYLSRALAGFSFDVPLREIAEKIAAGDVLQVSGNSAQLAASDPQGVIVHAALVHGFELVMIYGAAGAWVLALLSAVAFGTGWRTHRVEMLIDAE